jgi:hypothetical protein
MQRRFRSGTQPAKSRHLAWILPYSRLHTKGQDVRRELQLLRTTRLLAVTVSKDAWDVAGPPG